MTSNYPTSCLEVRRKRKVNKPIFKECPRKNICKYQKPNDILFSCSAGLQKENCLSDNYAIIVRYAIYKAWSVHKGQLAMHDAIVSDHQMVKLLILSHDHICNIMCIKTIGMARKCKESMCVSCGYSRKIRVYEEIHRRWSWQDITPRIIFMTRRVNGYS